MNVPNWLLFVLTLSSMLSFSVVAVAEDPQVDQYFTLPGDFAASHILISWKRAERAGPKVTRSKKEAKARASELAAILSNQPERFEELARSESDGPSARRNGNLKTFDKGDMAPPFEKELRNLAIGEITKEPVRTQFGYHIIRRNNLKIKHFTARALIITHIDAVRVKGIPSDSPGRQRSKQQARTHIEALQKKANPQNFKALIASESDLEGSGFMGILRRGQNSQTETMIEAIQNLEYQQISAVVELPMGFLLLQRQKVYKRAGSRIWIRFAGANGAPPSVTRSRDEALALALDLSQQLSTQANHFQDLAKKHSDGPFAVRGGRMANWFAGYQEPAIEEAIAGLEVGEITKKPVATDSGIFILKRESL